MVDIGDRSTIAPSFSLLDEMYTEIHNEELMAETFAPWDAADYIKTEEDVRRLLRAATEEDPGDGTVIRAVLKYIARTRNKSWRSDA